MCKKDILIFVSIYLLALKGSVKKSAIDDFREEIYRLLRESCCYSDFYRNLCKFNLFCHNPLYKGFIDLMSRFEDLLK